MRKDRFSGHHYKSVPTPYGGKAPLPLLRQTPPLFRQTPRRQILSLSPALFEKNNWQTLWKHYLASNFICGR